jgi:hypothetical protein
VEEEEMDRDEEVEEEEENTEKKRLSVKYKTSQGVLMLMVWQTTLH